MKTFVCILFLSFYLCLISVTNSAAQGSNSITGFIFGDSRMPVSDMYVELLDENYSTLGRMRTNGSGSYVFRGLSYGQFVIRVLTAGTDYVEQSVSVSLRSSFRDAGTISEQVDIYMKVKKRNIPPAAPPEAVFFQETPAEAKKMYDLGVSELDAKKDTGLAKLKESVEIFPDYFLALDRLGNEYLVRGYYSEAAALLTKAVSVNSRSFSSNFGLGLALYRLNKLDEAVKQFKNSITLHADSINAHLWLGISLHGKNELADALNSLIKADKLSQGSASEVHWQLARVYKDQKKFQKSADELELFLKYNPEAKNANEIKQIIATLKAKK